MSTEGLPDVISRYSFASLVTIAVAAVINGIKNHFVESLYPLVIKVK